MRPDDEARWVAQACAGDADAYAALIDTYQGMVFAVALNITGNYADSEDVLQEVFLQAYRKLRTLANPARFGAWLGTITRNLALQWLRKQRSIPVQVSGEGVLEFAHSFEESPAEAYARKELGALLWTEVAQLPPNSREAILLHYAEGFSIKRAATFLGISEGAFKMRLQYAREKLRDAMMERMEGELRRHQPGEKIRNAILAALPTSGVPGGPLLPTAAGHQMAGAATGKAATPVVALLLGKKAFIVAAVVLVGLFAAATLHNRTPKLPGPGPLSPGAQETDNHASRERRDPSEQGKRDDASTVGVAGATIALHAVRGSVVEKGSDRPVAGIGVVARMGSRVTTGTITDTKGTFELGGLANGRYGLFLEEADSAQQGKYVLAPADATLKITVMDEDVENIRVTLLPATHIRGTVIDQANHLVSSATLTLMEQWDVVSAHVMSDGEGRFEFRGVRPGADCSIACAASGFNSRTVYGVKPAIAQPVDNLLIQLHAGSGSSLSGKVVNGKKQPVEGTVMFCSYGSPRVTLLAQTGEDGAFAFSNVPPGMVSINCWQYEKSRHIAVKPNDSIRDILFEVDQEILPGLVSGAVVDGIGRPVARGWVSAAPPGKIEDLSVALLDANGRFKLRNLKPGTQIDVLHQGTVGPRQKTSAVNVPVSSEDLVVVFESPTKPPMTIRGRVIDKATRQAVTQFSAAVSNYDKGRPGESIEGERVVGFCDPKGRFEFVTGQYIPGRTCAYAEAPGYAGCYERVAAPSGKQEAEVVIALVPGGFIEGRTLNDKGKPVKGARVFMLSAEEDAVVTDADGKFRLERIGSSSVPYLCASHPDYAPFRSSKLDVSEESRVKDYLVRFTSGGTILGAVVDARGQRWPHAALRVATDSYCYWPRTDKDGMYVADRLPPGKYEVSVKDAAMDRRTAELKDGETVTVNFGVEGVTVSGKVSIGGKPCAGVQVQCDDRQFVPRSANSVVRCNSAADGSYVLRNVLPGRRYLKVMVSRLPLCSVPLDVVEGKDMEKDLVLESGTIEGTVVYRRDNSPVPGARVLMYAAGGMPGGVAGIDQRFIHGELYLADATSDAQGRFRFDPVGPGEYTLEARTTGNRGDGFAEVKLEAGQSLRNVSVLFGDEADVLVSAVDAQGGRQLALRGMLFLLDGENRVVARRLDGPTPSVLSGVPAGTYSVAAMMEDASQAVFSCPYQQDVRLEAGSGNKIVLPMRVTVDATVTVTNSSGQPVDGFTCAVRDSSGVQIPVPMVDGSEVRLRVPPGTYELILASSGKTLFSGPITVAVEPPSTSCRIPITVAAE